MRDSKKYVSMFYCASLGSYKFFQRKKNTQDLGRALAFGCLYTKNHPMLALAMVHVFNIWWFLQAKKRHSRADPPEKSFDPKQQKVMAEEQR